MAKAQMNPAEQSMMMEPTRISVTIPNKLGLHLRPASQLVKVANRYDDCEIQLSKDGQQVNAKSIMGVIMLAAEQGSFARYGNPSCGILPRGRPHC